MIPNAPCILVSVALVILPGGSFGQTASPEKLDPCPPKLKTAKTLLICGKSDCEMFGGQINLGNLQSDGPSGGSARIVPPVVLVFRDQNIHFKDEFQKFNLRPWNAYLDVKGDGKSFAPLCSVTSGASKDQIKRSLGFLR